MSTFSGYIPEIPYISVDRFQEKNKNSQMFFLSHCHTDHMEGLDNEELRNMLFMNNVHLYASSISLKILRNKHPKFTASFKELPTGAPYSITVPGKFGEEEKHLCVTTIPAGHCPGSVMFLFQTEGKSILYTGDFRINAKELHKYKAFHDCAGNVNKLDILYLDTTFCNSMYEHFPSREESMKETCKLVEEWTSVSDRHIIDLWLTSYYGLEYLFEELFRRTNNYIHVLKEVYNLYKYMPDLAKIIVTNPARAKIHTRLSYSNVCCNITNRAAYFRRTIRPSAMIWDNLKPSQGIVTRVNENLFRVCYSNHASLSEIREFVRYLKPLRIEPCVVPEDFDERKSLFSLLDEMVSEYTPKENKEVKADGNKQFPLIDVVTSSSKSAKCVEYKKQLSLLSSPPRNLVRKRRISEVGDS